MALVSVMFLEDLQCRNLILKSHDIRGNSDDFLPLKKENKKQRLIHFQQN